MFRKSFSLSWHIIISKQAMNRWSFKTDPGDCHENQFVYVTRFKFQHYMLNSSICVSS